MQKLGSWLWLQWLRLLQAVFVLLCLRCVAIQVMMPWPAPVVAGPIAACGLAIALWNPNAGLYAFSVLLLVANGLARSAFLAVGEPTALLFASIYLGLFLRALRRGEEMRGALAPGERRVLLAVDAMISVFVLSLLWQASRHYGNAGPFLWDRNATVYGFGDHRYFMTSAFLWLQGLYFFRVLFVRRRRVADGGVDPGSWIPAVFAAYAAALIAFFAFQLLSGIPRPLIGVAYYLPLEDISSFGSIGAALLVFFIARSCFRPVGRGVLSALLLAALAFCVVASWSRAAWLAAVVMTLAVLSFRIPWKAMAWLLCAAAIAVAVVNINARNDAWLNSPYLARLIHLVRLENPANKSPERMYLYHKAAAVLREKPLVGGGVGSFYLDSPKYAAAGDPNALVPDFAHNAFLQLAVDVGIPAAAVFALIVASSFLCAFRRMRRLGPAAGPEKRLLMGASFALAAYLMTQMTGNSLNVYPSNQFIFWLLTAFLMRPAAGGREDRAHEGA